MQKWNSSVLVSFDIKITVTLVNIQVKHEKKLTEFTFEGLKFLPVGENQNTNT